MLAMLAACGEDPSGDGGQNAGSGGAGPTQPDKTDPPTDPGDAGEQGSSGGSGITHDEPAGEILKEILDALNELDIDKPMSLPPAAVTGEDSGFIIGLPTAKFNDLVLSASQTTAAIGTFAHQIIIIKAKDDASANEIKNIVSGAGGYDSQKWVCVFPDRSIVAQSGRYLMVAAARNPVIDALQDIFKDIFGDVSDVVTFWEHEGGDDAGGGLGGGMLLPPAP